MSSSGRVQTKVWSSKHGPEREREREKRRGRGGKQDEDDEEGHRPPVVRVLGLGHRPAGRMRRDHAQIEGQNWASHRGRCLMGRIVVLRKITEILCSLTLLC